MKIEVKCSTMVKPMIEKPSTTLWLSNMDLVMALNYHTCLPFFYSSTGSAADFFDSTPLKAALSRVLVQFYPLAGRLMKNEHNGRLEVNCNGEGALFVEAESDGTLDDLGDFAPRPELTLTPPIDYSGGISSFPLLIVQLTRFKCGGVCLVIGSDHELADGFGIMHFIKTWCGITRGLDIAVAASVDRRALSARNPPLTNFTHLEYKLAPKSTPQTNAKVSPQTLIFSTFKITRRQLKALKDNCQDHQDDLTNKVTYSSYEVFAAHVWRAVTKARALPEDEETILYIPVDGRSRIQPPLPPGFLGNAVFRATSIASSGELESNPIKFAARKIHDAIERMDNEYLRSAIDCLELQDGIETRVRVTNPYKCPNLAINGWARFPVYDVDFGWGKPVYVGFNAPLPEGTTVLLPSPTNDGSLLYAISLPKEQMQVFEKLFYQI